MAYFMCVICMWMFLYQNPVRKSSIYTRLLVLSFVDYHNASSHFSRVNGRDVEMCYIGLLSVYLFIGLGYLVILHVVVYFKCFIETRSIHVIGYVK